MTKLEHIKTSFRKMEELHRLPLMILAWMFSLLLVKDMAMGILLGAGGVLAFLILEGSRFFFEKFLPPVWQAASYLIMLVSLSGILGILLHLLRAERTDVPVYWFMLEQAASIYLMKMLMFEIEKRKSSKTEEKTAETGAEEGNGKRVLKMLLSCFETAVEYMMFLGILGVIREYVERWVPLVQLFSGGLLITAGLTFLWKLTKTMPERFTKLPGMVLGTGLIGLVLAGFAGLL